MALSEPVIIALVSAISGIAIAYLTNVASKKVQRKKQKAGPIDRMNEMFDGYERLIKQKDAEDERKAQLITELQEEVRATRDIVKRLELSLENSRRELRNSRNDAQELREVLAELREDYNNMKEKESYERL